MARKFQIGDVVRIERDLLGNSLGYNFKVGCRGVVVEYKATYAPNSYKIRRKINDQVLWFSARELKLIKRKTKKVKV